MSGPRHVASLTRRFVSVRVPSLIALAALTLLLIAAVGAEPLTSIPNPRTRDGTWVTDVPGVLRADTIARLNSTIGEFERTNGAEMAIVVIRSLDGLSIEETAVKLFELWGIGKKSKDNGLLLLWSTGDRRVRVEVGYGLEGVLPDGKVGRILDAYVMPKFRAGQFDEGLLAGVDALLSAARDEPVELPSPRSESYENGSSGIIAAVIGLLAGIPISVGSIVGFRKWRRRHRRRCPACQTLMICLDEADDDALLEKGQQAEERIGSVDYDVWKCGACGHHFTLRYPKWFSSYAQCPQCHKPNEVVHRGGRQPGEHDQQRQRARRRDVRVLRLPSGVHEGSSDHRSLQRVVVKRLVERRVQQFWRRRIGWWRSQQGLLARS